VAISIYRTVKDRAIRKVLIVGWLTCGQGAWWSSSMYMFHVIIEGNLPWQCWHSW
jgi:hypothetical protein